MPEAPSALVKIFFPTDSDDWHGSTGEWMWASLPGTGRYRIENNPFCAYGVSYHDIVSATPTPDGALHFCEIVERGGHSLYRVILGENATIGDFLGRWQPMEIAGCSYESNSTPEDVFSIDVPPDVDVYFVYAVLEKGFDDGLWDFEEASFQHPLADPRSS